MSDAATSPPGEDPAQRVVRNWNEMLQEIRVVQTGTQILTGFLLVLPFQSRFAELGAFEHTIYLVLLGFAALATVLALTPVSLHRGLFRRQAKETIVRIGNRILKAAIATIGITLVGTVLLVFSVVLDPVAGLLAGSAALVVLTVFWLVLPGTIRARRF